MADKGKEGFDALIEGWRDSDWWGRMFLISLLAFLAAGALLFRAESVHGAAWAIENWHREEIHQPQKGLVSEQLVEFLGTPIALGCLAVVGVSLLVLLALLAHLFWFADRELEDS